MHASTSATYSMAHYTAEPPALCALAPGRTPRGQGHRRATACATAGCIAIQRLAARCYTAHYTVIFAVYASNGPIQRTIMVPEFLLLRGHERREVLAWHLNLDCTVDLLHTWILFDYLDLQRRLRRARAARHDSGVSVME